MRSVFSLTFISFITLSSYTVTVLWIQLNLSRLSCIRIKINLFARWSDVIKTTRTALCTCRRVERFVGSFRLWHSLCLKMETGVKMHMKEWLIAQIESGKYEGLCWEDEDKTMFRIPWKHAAKKDYKQTADAALFKVNTLSLFHNLKHVMWIFVNSVVVTYSFSMLFELMLFMLKKLILEVSCSQIQYFL